MTVNNVNVLITGASGLLGRQILTYFENAELHSKYPVDDIEKFKFNCLGLCHSRAKANLRPIDLNNFEQVDKLIDEFKPNVIIHSAAVKRVESVESDYDGAVRLNRDVTGYLAKVAAQLGILFIYISTDYIFDGTNPPYKIDSQTNPLNKYGKSKLLGEEVTKEASENHCIVRVPILYGFTEPNNYGESAINVLIENVRKGSPIKIDHQQTRFPTHCIDVSRFLARLVIKYYQENGTQPNPVRGVFHCSGLESFTKYEISCIMADAYGLSKEFMQPDLTSDFTLRPKNAQLDTSETYKFLTYQPVMLFKPSIKECLENFV
ncbi:unnamed protein product [Brachionus calyciflorus]|uniref:Methionine adenosyltransferase 2 subunit beta n=1 Tax=Brachionus calyciflorus TaxID=104777 RepID=A0A813M952_9BILA|nr:unnamed protein product [Brachionus calyciflorus]